MAVAHHMALSPAGVEAAAPARTEASMQVELWVVDAALQIPACRECLGPLPEAGRDGPLSLWLFTQHLLRFWLMQLVLRPDVF